MMLIAYGFAVGLAVGTVLWILFRLLWLRPPTLAVLRRDEIVAVNWTAVVVEGRLVRNELEDRV
ncbi:MAG: hypothetical protein EPN41_08625 [Candidimonas sp.]|nr:MAG: hypothetical protein EPN41_08625 [Candidimonas sp.]